MTKVAFFDFTGCEGCEFHLLSLNELLLDFFQDFEITRWRLLKEGGEKDFDLALAAGKDLTVPMPVASMVGQCLASAKATGKGELDYASLVVLAEELAGIK